MTDDTADIPPSVLDEAARWHARLTSGAESDDDIARHMDWLLADPAHLAAYERIAAAVHAAGGAEAAVRAAYPDAFAAPRSARQAVPQSGASVSGVPVSGVSVSGIPGAGAEADSDSEIRSEAPSATGRAPGRNSGHVTRHGWRAAWRWPRVVAVAVAIAALLFVAVMPMTGLFEGAPAPTVYTAGDDRVRTVRLADGSEVSLFLGSAVSVAVTDRARTASLVRGRAVFTVTPDRDRPFHVDTDRGRVSVVGTRFEVVRGERFDRVAVSEGRVAVAPIRPDTAQPPPGRSDTSGSGTVLLDPGFAVRYDGHGGTPLRMKADIAAIGAWSAGVLVFEGTPLPEVVARINDLFSDRSLVLGDPALTAGVFSGTLAVSTAGEMARQLAAFLSLGVSDDVTEIVLTPGR
ncbi:FecR family protein [Eilatimonas milleporae]|uniref:FecR family protein n=1 Tax=Eilatimonas milleporae TaxID=911205 RepID=A0A3M0CEH2_9PROT|nr:FecR domain-containing protein [Eilatimonas milleporae]RMB07752.1 FecR family protein [Eilatimonas milleporae]